MIDPLRIGIEEGLKYLPFILAGCILFRIAHFPDIGIEGTFALGASFMALSSHLSLPLWLGVFGASLFGGLGGLLTGTLFVKFRLNSLLCGIITTFIAYSTCYCLLGFKSTASITTNATEIITGLFGLCCCLIICLIFSTSYGLQMRIAGESPLLLKKMGILPYNKILLLLIIGNMVSGASGALVASTEGTSNLYIADSKLFLAIIALVIGEGILSLMISATNKLVIKFSNNKSDNITINFLVNVLSGSGVFYLVLASIIGTFGYWVLYNMSTYFFGADEFTKMMLGFVTAILMYITTKTSKKNHIIPYWTFIGELP